MNLYKLSLVSAVLLSMFSGCSYMTVLRTQELRNVESRVDSLNRELSELQKAMMAEQKGQTEMLRLMRADQQVRFSELDQKISSIQGNLSENQMRLSKIDEKTAEFQRKFEARLGADSVASNSRNAEIEKLFQIAMSDFNAGRYDLAKNGFEDLVKQFPESPYAQESEYWMAECLYAKKQLDDAQKSYMAYIKKYPEGTKFCVSLYKLGLSYEKQQQGKSRDMVWKKLMEQCPESQESQMVKNR